MTPGEHCLNSDQGRRSTSAYRQAILTRAEEIHALKTRGLASESLHVEHAAIEQLLQSLHEAVVSGAGRADCIEILNTAIDFCATHFADEEGFMRNNCHVCLDAHAAAHKQILSKFVTVRRSASGEGLPLAALDAAGLLDAFHDHVNTYDRGAYLTSDPQT